MADIETGVQTHIHIYTEREKKLSKSTDTKREKDIRKGRKKEGKGERVKKKRKKDRKERKSKVREGKRRKEGKKKK